MPGYSLLFSVCLMLGAISRPPAGPTPPQQPLERHEYKQYHMGVDVRIVVYTPDLETAENACTAAFARFAELDSIMSDYRVNSELTLLCNRSGGPPVKISRDLFVVLERAQEIARKSGGAFDVTCGPLIRLWRGARRSSILPTPEEIALARRQSGWRKLKLDRKKQTARLMVAGMKLDLGGIAKGYADDCAQEVLKKHGVTRALVEAGGDIVVSDPPPGEKGWKIAVANAVEGPATAPRHSERSEESRLQPTSPRRSEHGEAEGAGPVPGEESRLQPTTPRHSERSEESRLATTQEKQTPLLTFANCAVSTSGDIFQSVTVGGKRYSHIIDPRTGWALTDRIQVTIVAKDGFTSDPLSKVVSVLGPIKGTRLAEKYRGVKKIYVRYAGRFE